MKYCSLCQRYVEPQKKFSWPLFIFLCCTIVGGGVYLLWYFVFAKKKYCPICKSTKLVKYSPEDIESKKLEKQEKAEKRKEAIMNMKDKITETVSGKTAE